MSQAGNESVSRAQNKEIMNEQIWVFASHDQAKGWLTVCLPVGSNVATLPVGGNVAALPVGCNVTTLPVGGSVASLPVGCNITTLPVGGSVAARDNVASLHLDNRIDGTLGDLCIETKEDKRHTSKSKNTDDCTHRSTEDKGEKAEDCCVPGEHRECGFSERRGCEEGL
jgi:hypothetical protein